MTSLYRLYDCAGELLYVGISDRFPTRMAEHSDDKSWWDKVATITIEQFATAEEARRAEQDGIDLGSPAYNQIRAFGKTPITGFRIPEDVKAAAVERATAEGKTLTDVVVAHLRRYGKGKR